MMRIEWEVYGEAWRLVPGDNTREHWATKAKRLKGQREGACVLTLKEMLGTRLVTPLDWRHATVTITRIGKRKMDDDNLAGSAKAVRDGIAQSLRLDDGNDRYMWRYAQAGGTRYGVRVSIELEGVE